MTLDEAISVFDKSATRTTPNAQTEAWTVIRSQIFRLKDAPEIPATQAESVSLAGGNHWMAKIVLLGPIAKQLGGKRVRLVELTGDGIVELGSSS